MTYKYFPPHLTHVTALPCETQTFEISFHTEDNSVVPSLSRIGSDSVRRLILDGAEWFHTGAGAGG